MTNQEIYDHVKEHLLRQGSRSTSGGNCAYRGDNGTMCAIGCLIPDEMYHATMEGVTIYEVDALHKEDAWASWVIDTERTWREAWREWWDTTEAWKHVDLLVELQDTHDGIQPQSWPAALADTAERFGLKP